MPRREGPGTRGRWRWPRTAREGRGQQLKASGSPGRGDTPPGPRPQPPAAAGTPGSRGRRAGPRPRPARGLRVPRRRVAVLSGGGSVSDLPKLPETAAARSPPRPLLVPVRVPSAPGPRSPPLPRRRRLPRTRASNFAPHPRPPSSRSHGHGREKTGREPRPGQSPGPRPGHKSGCAPRAGGAAPPACPCGPPRACGPGGSRGGPGQRHQRREQRGFLR